MFQTGKAFVEHFKTIFFSVFKALMQWVSLIVAAGGPDKQKKLTWCEIRVWLFTKNPKMVYNKRG